MEPARTVFCLRPEEARGKRLFLFTFCFYFMVAGFTYFSPLPEVDKMGLIMVVIQLVTGVAVFSLTLWLSFVGYITLFRMLKI